MKKLGIAALVVGMMLVFSAGVWAEGQATVSYQPGLKLPAYITGHSHFSAWFTATMADYAAGKLYAQNVGWLEMANAGTFRLLVKLTGITGGAHADRVKAIDAFKVRGRSRKNFTQHVGWRDFDYGAHGLPQTWRVGTGKTYAQAYIDYQWDFSDLAADNAGKQYVYSITFINIAP